MREPKQGGGAPEKSIHERLLGALEPDEPRKKPRQEVVDGQPPDEDILEERSTTDPDDDLGDDPDEGADDDEGGWDGEEYDEEDPTEPDDEGRDTPLWTVKVDGEEIQVPEDELVAGYSRTAHFTRSMQALRAREQEFEGEIAAVSQEREQYKTLLVRLHQHLQEGASGRTPEEWAELERTDPIGFLQERERERDRLARVADTEAEYQRVQAQQQQEAQRQLDNLRLQEAQKLFQAVPEWQDEKVYRKETARIASYAKSHGFTDEELTQVIDHRIVLMLRDAALGARVKTEKGNLRGKRRGTKPARPGSGNQSRVSQPRQRKQARQARERLHQTGKVEDAAKVLRHLL